MRGPFRGFRRAIDVWRPSGWRQRLGRVPSELAYNVPGLDDLGVLSRAQKLNERESTLDPIVMSVITGTQYEEAVDLYALSRGTHLNVSKGIAKYGSGKRITVGELDQNCWQFARSMLLTHYSSVRGTWYLPSWTEVADYVSGIHSTPGPFWNQYFNTKSESLSHALPAAEELWQALLDGEDVVPLWKVSGKVEIRKRKRLIEGSNRIFFSPGMDWFLVEVRLCLPLLKADEALLNTGKNFTLQHGGLLKAMRKADPYDLKMVEDFSMYDASSQVYEQVELADLYREIFEIPAIYASLMRKIFLHATVSCCWCPNGHVYLKKWGFASGSFTTTKRQTDRHRVQRAYVWAKAALRAGVDLRTAARKWMDSVTYICGDDLFQAFDRHPLTDVYAREEFQIEEFSQLGLVVKPGSLELSPSLVGLTYLGRHVTLDPPAVYFHDPLKLIASALYDFRPATRADKLRGLLLEVGWQDGVFDVLKEVGRRYGILDLPSKPMVRDLWRVPLV